MVFGFFIDVPLIVGGFVLMLVYRDKITRRLARLESKRLPALVLSVLVSVPLIYFEEQINCMQNWCGQVLVPPTLGFIVVEIFLLGVLTLRLHAVSTLRVTLLFSIFGVFWELLLGGLVGAPLLVDLLLGPYVMISYGFVSLLPLNILLIDRKNPKQGPMIEATGPEPQPIISPGAQITGEQA